MKVAIDKNCINQIKDFTEFDYIYVFDNEPLKELLNLKLHCINKDFLDEVDINLSSYDIKCLKKANHKDKDWKKLPELKKNKFAIIVPNYNYEHTIEKCLTSILNQTYQNFEIIFVDDMSTDNSIDIAQTTYLKYCAKKLKGQKSEFAELPKNFKLVKLKQKRLNGGARNEAYLHISEDVDYVMYVDSDDWLLNENVLEQINRALISNPDVLFIGMSDYINGVTKECYLPTYKDKYEAIQGWSGSCGKVIRKELATRQECLYPEGTLKEDRTQHRKICIYMKNFELLKKPLYVWNRSN